MLERLEHQDYYQILEVPYQATWGEIQKAYEFAKITYSQGALGSYSLFDFAERGTILDKIEEAYQILNHPENRRKYDQALGKQTAPIAEPLLVPLKAMVTAMAPPPPVYEVNAAPLPSVLPSVEINVQKAPEPSVLASVEINMQKVPEPVTPVVPDAPIKIEPDEHGIIEGKILKVFREKQGIPLSEIADQTRISINYLEFIESNNYHGFPAPVYLFGYLKQYTKMVGLAHFVVEGYMKGYQKWLETSGQNARFQ
ncbi:MAG: helix-turn-helix domain-containing protein [Nitrospirota bacterium]